MSVGVACSEVGVKVDLGVGGSSFTCVGIEVWDTEVEVLAHEFGGCEGIGCIAGFGFDGVGRRAEVGFRFGAVIGADWAWGIGVIDPVLIEPVIGATYGSRGCVYRAGIAIFCAAWSGIRAFAHCAAPRVGLVEESAVRRGFGCYVIIISSTLGERCCMVCVGYNGVL